MSATRRATAVTLALAIGLMACADLLNPTIPRDAPGVLVTGLTGECPGFSDCMQWSTDSKTLYLVATLAAPLGPSLVAVDPATGAFRRLGSIDAAATQLAPSPDGTTMYFSVATDSARTRWDIKRMSLADGAIRTVTSSGTFDFLLSPDGTALAYSAVGVSVAADTVVLLDVASGARRATTVVKQSRLRAFSADGTRLLMNSALTEPRSVQIWHVATGARDTIPSGLWTTYLMSIHWSRGDFRVLYFVAGPGPIAYTDTALSGGTAITYVATRNTDAVAWVPDRSAVFMAIQSAHCYGQEDCSAYHYDLVYTTATKTTSVGTVNGKGFRAFVASPDGRWLAHVVTFGGLYLLNQPTP